MKLAIKGDKAVTFSALTTYAIRKAVKLTYKSYNFGEHLADETIQEYQFDAQNPVSSDMLQYLFPGNADLSGKTAAFGFSNFNSTNEAYCKKFMKSFKMKPILNQKFQNRMHKETAISLCYKMLKISVILWYLFVGIAV